MEPLEEKSLVVTSRPGTHWGKSFELNGNRNVHDTDSEPENSEYMTVAIETMRTAEFYRTGIIDNVKITSSLMSRKEHKRICL